MRPVASELERRIYLNRLRLREEEVARDRPSFIERLLCTTGIQLADRDFIDLEEGDLLTTQALERRKELTPDIQWRRGTESHVARTMDGLSSALGSQRAHLLGHAAVETAGVPLVPVAPFLASVFRYWQPQQEDVCLATAGAQDGCFLEWDLGEGYELTTWGLFAHALIT